MLVSLQAKVLSSWVEDIHPTQKIPWKIQTTSFVTASWSVQSAKVTYGDNVKHAYPMSMSLVYRSGVCLISSFV